MTGAGSQSLTRGHLSLVVFLQFACWGAWTPVLGRHLELLGFTPTQIGSTYATGAIATIVAPLIGGQIADRWFPIERVTAIAFAIAGVLFAAARTATSFSSVWWLALGAMLSFAPTLGLTNALCFRHLRDAPREFPRIRLFGTVGWIAAGWILAEWMRVTGRPIGDCFLFAALFAVLAAIATWTLPRTELAPRQPGQAALAIRSVAQLLRSRSFSAFSALSCGLMVFGAFYYTRAAPFLATVGFSDSALPVVLSVGQITEIAAMLALPAAYRTLGPKLTMAIGLWAWTARFALFALGGPPALLIAAQALHGLGFAFGVAAAMIYVDEVVPNDARATGQSFLAWLTYGVGMLVGSHIAGIVAEHSGGAREMWSIPAIGCAAVALLFTASFSAVSSRSA